ncbi:MAG TPA: phosphatidylserine decarboxylase [Vicinamibacterales bacterium]
MGVRLDPAGWPFISGAVALAILGGAVAWPLSVPFLILTAFFLFFFRDPDRHHSANFDSVISPADGRVLVAGDAVPDAAPAGTWKQISIFLSPMDVHVNRIPASGRVTKVAFTPGKFLAAYKHDAASTNERSEIWIDHGGQMVVSRQIVGFLARRVVCRATPGLEVRAGDRYGVMKFGSRMDVFLPTTAEILVKVGDMVRGGETVIAVLR